MPVRLAQEDDYHALGLYGGGTLLTLAWKPSTRLRQLSLVAPIITSNGLGAAAKTAPAPGRTTGRTGRTRWSDGPDSWTDGPDDWTDGSDQWTEGSDQWTYGGGRVLRRGGRAVLGLGFHWFSGTHEMTKLLRHAGVHIIERTRQRSTTMGTSIRVTTSSTAFLLVGAP